MTRSFTPLTGIPLEIWEATAIVLESAFTGIVHGGHSDTEFTWTITGGNAFTP